VKAIPVRTSAEREELRRQNLEQQKTIEV